MRQFHQFFSHLHQNVPQPVGQIPWGHVRTLLAKVKSADQALLCAQACVDHGWNRTVLEWQIEHGYHMLAGKVVGNFANTLPPPQSDLVQQSLKDPYVFDFLTLAPTAVERDIENLFSRYDLDDNDEQALIDELILTMEFKSADDARTSRESCVIQWRTTCPASAES